MKKLIIRITCLGLPFLLIIVFFEFKYSRIYNNEYLAKKHLIGLRAQETEILMLGSSHAFYGLIPQYFGSNSFNLAALSQTLYYDTQLTIKLLPKLPKLKTVVIPISTFSLESQLDEGIERWRCYYYSKIYGIPHRERKLRYEIRNFSYFFLYRHSQDRMKKDILSEFDSQGGLKDEHGTLSLQEMENSAAAVTKRHADGMNVKNLPENLSYLKELALQLKSKKIELILVTLPVSRQYQDGFRQDLLLRMRTTLEKFCMEHEVKYYDLYGDSRFELNDFLDADHLNHTGAIKFSKLFSDKITTLPANSISQ